VELKRVALVILSVVACRRAAIQSRLPHVTPSPTTPSVAATPLVKQVYRIGGDVRAPVLQRSSSPRFPKSKVARSWSGTAFLFEAEIDEAGQVGKITTLKRPVISPPWPEIEKACRDALQSWQYKPALRDGKPVPVYLTVAVTVDF
jgi:outer membrane biosynthesis protein TonB